MPEPGLDVLVGLGVGMSHLSKGMGKVLHCYFLPIPATPQLHPPQCSTYLKRKDMSCALPES